MPRIWREPFSYLQEKMLRPETKKKKETKYPENQTKTKTPTFFY